MASSASQVSKLGSSNEENRVKQEMKAGNVAEEPQKDCITRCFSGNFNMGVFKARYFLIVFFILLGIAAGVIASNIGPITEPEEYLPNEHELIVLQRDIEGKFTSSAGIKEALVVKLNWGVKDLDRSDVGLWDPQEIGKIVWDDDFTIAPRANQQALMDLCTDLRDNFELVKNNGVQCWILDMAEFVQDCTNPQNTSE